MTRGRLVAIVVGVLLLSTVGSCAAVGMHYRARADRFDGACGATLGQPYARVLTPFDGMHVVTMQIGKHDPNGELVVSHHYGLAGSADCSIDLHDDVVARATPSRHSDFDHCSDPGAYPRRHWVCQVARAVVP